MTPSNRIAVCPGSYDPVTWGHLDVITRAAQLFDELIVAVVNAPMRKVQTLFLAEERIEMIRQATTQLANVKVEAFDVLLVEFARTKNAMAIVKGLRAISDFEYELEMNQLNRQLSPDMESVYLMASPRYSFLSSSGVKEIASFGGDVSELVPEHVARRLTEAYERQ